MNEDWNLDSKNWKRRDSGVFCIDPLREAFQLEAREETKSEKVKRLVGRLNRMPAVREDRVRMIREQIANGTFDTEERWARAVEKLRGDLLG